MTRYLVLSLAVLLAPSLSGQQRDSVRQRGDSAAARQLRARIDSAFGRRVQEDLKLTPDQSSKLRATQEKFGTRRRSLMQQQMERRRALDDQMQPGIAANSDSVRKLMDGMRAGRGEMVRIEQDEDQEMSGYLNPVQRARYQQMREQFMRRIVEMRMERREQRGIAPRRGMGAPGPRLRGGRRRGI